MKIICTPPPRFDEIKAAFPQATRHGVIFAWGETIYNPSAVIISEELVAHERVHARQQEKVGGPDTWWTKYIEDAGFRFEQELPAHRAELAHYCKNHKDRNAQVRQRAIVADKLAGELYGGVVTAAAAFRMLKL